MLYCQQELTSLEETLVTMDAEDECESKDSLLSVELDENRRLTPWRKELLQKIKEKLFEYGELPLIDRNFP